MRISWSQNWLFLLATPLSDKLLLGHFQGCYIFTQQTHIHWAHLYVAGSLLNTKAHHSHQFTCFMYFPAPGVFNVSCCLLYWSTSSSSSRYQPSIQFFLSHADTKNGQSISVPKFLFGFWARFLPCSYLKECQCFLLLHPWYSKNCAYTRLHACKEMINSWSCINECISYIIMHFSKPS